MDGDSSSESSSNNNSSEDDENSGQENNDEDGIPKVTRTNILSIVTNNNMPLTARIAVIVIYFNLPNKVTNLILALLIALGLDVPKDARTIRKTPRYLIADDTFHHFGLVKGLLRKLKRDEKKRKKLKYKFQLTVYHCTTAAENHFGRFCVELLVHLANRSL